MLDISFISISDSALNVSIWGNPWLRDTKQDQCRRLKKNSNTAMVALNIGFSSPCPLKLND